MNIAIAIFAKNSDLSPVKTRLAQDIGKDQAIAAYQQLLEITTHTVQHFNNRSQYVITPYWALAEQESISLAKWRNFQTLWTGEGNLGERLHQVYNTLIQQYDAVILIGSDCPHLSLDGFDKLLENYLLQQENCIIGPCEDGGFYLFAYSQPLPKSLWLAINYSCYTTRKELIQALQQQGIQSFLLPELFDIDTQKDFIRWQEKI